MEYIRRSYGVPAKRGMRICYSAEGPGEPNGTITGARDARLLIRLDGWPKRRRPLAFHPTWNIHYPPTNVRCGAPAAQDSQSEANEGAYPPLPRTNCSPSVGDNDAACPTCGHVPDTHRKRQVRHLHCKSEGMVKFITELQGVLGVTGGFKRMIAEVKILKENSVLSKPQSVDNTQ